MKLHLDVAALLLLRADKMDDSGHRIVNQLVRSANGNTDRTRLLKKAYSPNALTSQEIFVAIATFLVMLTVLIKLAVSTLPWHIRLWAWLMVYGWVMMQILQIIFNSREVDDTNLGGTVRYAGLVPRYLEPPVLELILSAVSLPSFGYMGYISIFRPETMPPFLLLPLTFIWEFLKDLGLGVIFLILSLILPTFAGVGADVLSGRVEGPRGTVYGVFGTALFCIVGLIEIIAVCFWQEYGYQALDKLLRVLDMPLRGIGLVCRLITLYALFVWPAFGERGVGHGLEAKRPLLHQVLNLSLTAAVFVGVMVTYDPAGTSQPNWANWLG